MGDFGSRECVPRIRASATTVSFPTTLSSISVQTTLMSQPAEQDLSVYYVYLVIEMVYSAESIESFETFFALDFSQFLSPGFHNVRVIVVLHEEFLYGQLDRVKHQTVTKFRRNSDGM